MVTIRILSFVCFLLFLHGCSAPFYSVMPNDLIMLEKKGDQATGFGMAVAPFSITYCGFSGYYAYALPAGFRLRADFQTLTSSGFLDGDGAGRSSIFTYGLGAAHYVQLSNRVQLETNIMVRKADGRYWSRDDSFRGKYLVNSTNIYTGIRYRAFDSFFIETTVGHQWNSFGDLQVTEGVAVGRNVNRYRGVDKLSNFVWGGGLGVKEDGLEFMIFSNFTFGNETDPLAGLYQDIIFGTRFNVMF